MTDWLIVIQRFVKNICSLVLQIEQEEYGEALALATVYGLDCDLVYQRQWRRTPVSVASIQDYLRSVLHLRPHPHPYPHLLLDKNSTLNPPQIDHSPMLIALFESQ